MADTKISSLPQAATIAAADEFVLNQSGTTKRAPRSLLNTISEVSSSEVFTVSNTGTGGAARISASGTDPALRIIQTGAGPALFVEDNDQNPDATPLLVNQDGKLLVGKTTTRIYNSTTPSLQVEGTLLGTSSIGLTCNNSTSAGSSGILYLSRSRGTTVGSSTIVQDGDVIGNISFQGTDGVETIQGATIQAYVDGTPGVGDLPTAISIATRDASSASPAPRIAVRASGVTEFKENIQLDISKGIQFGSNATLQTTPYAPLTGTVATTAISIAIGAQKAYTVTVSGAVLGDIATASCSFSLGTTDATAVQITAAVTAANQVTVLLCNQSTTAFSVPVGTIKARVIK